LDSQKWRRRACSNSFGDVLRLTFQFFEVRRFRLFKFFIINIFRLITFKRKKRRKNMQLSLVLSALIANLACRIHKTIYNVACCCVLQERTRMQTARSQVCTCMYIHVQVYVVDVHVCSTCACRKPAVLVATWNAVATVEHFALLLPLIHFSSASRCESRKCLRAPFVQGKKMLESSNCPVLNAWAILYSNRACSAGCVAATSNPADARAAPRPTPFFFGAFAP